jgi:glutamate racemase
MKIGIFDSGLGGLIILRELKRQLPKYDYVYLGDTENLPYGEKTQKRIFELTQKGVEYLFKQDCALVIVACNTASSQALRKIQQEYLPKSKYSDRKVLGIIRPTVECVPKTGKVGLIGTRRTIDSQAYKKEFIKTGHKISLLMKATPKLATMIESGELDEKVLNQYLTPFKKAKVETLVLACTHYGDLKKTVVEIMSDNVRVIAQDDILPKKLKQYLKKHPEVSKKLAHGGKTKLLLTKTNARYQARAKEWFGSTKLTQVQI